MRRTIIGLIAALALLVSIAYVALYEAGDTAVWLALVALVFALFYIAQQLEELLAAVRDDDRQSQA